MSWWEFNKDLFCSDSCVRKTNSFLEKKDKESLYTKEEHLSQKELDSLVEDEELISELNEEFKVFLDRNISSEEIEYLKRQRKIYFNKWMSAVHDVGKKSYSEIQNYSQTHKEVFKSAFKRNFHINGKPLNRNSRKLFKGSIQRIDRKIKKSNPPEPPQRVILGKRK